MTKKRKRNPKARRTEKEIRADLKFERGMRASERKRLKGMKGEGRAMQKSLMAITQETIDELEAELAGKRARIAATPKRTKPTGVYRRRAGTTTQLRNANRYPRLPKYGEVYRRKVGDFTVVVRGIFGARGDSYHARVLRGAGRQEDEKTRGQVVRKMDFPTHDHLPDATGPALAEAKKWATDMAKGKRSAVERNYFDMSIPNSKLGG